MEYTAIDAMKLFPTVAELAKMSINQLAEYYNAAITDFNLEHFRKIQKFQNKAVALERVNHLIWILCMMVEKNDLKKQFDDMISLKIDVDKVSHADKAAFLWEIFVTPDIKMIKSCFVGLCEYAKIHRRTSSNVWVEKIQAYSIRNKDDRSAIVQIIPIGKEEPTTKKKLLKKTSKPIIEEQVTEQVPEAPKKKLLKKKAVEAIVAAPVKKLLKKKTNEENTMAKKEAASKTTKTTKAAVAEEPKKKAAAKNEEPATKTKAAKLEVVKPTKALNSALLCDLYDAMMDFVRNNMEIGQQATVKTSIGEIVAAKVINELGVSEFSTKWTIDGIDLSKAVLQYLLTWNGKNNDEDTKKRVPNMKSAVERWLKVNSDFVVDGMFAEEDEKPATKKGKVKAKKEEEAEEEQDAVEDDAEEEKPAPKKGKKAAAKEEPEPAPKKGKGKKVVEPEPVEEEGHFTDDELETEIKRKKAEKALYELFEEEELENVLDEAFDGSKTATLKAIYDAIVGAEFDADDEDLIDALKSLV